MTSLLRPRVVLFDVMGTVVDDDGCVRRDTTAVLRRAGLADADIERVLIDSAGRLESLMKDINARRRSWLGHRALRVLAVRESVAALSLPPLSRDLEADVATIADRLTPWPDSASALTRLRRSAITVALSNADTAELAAMSAHGDLSWHAVLSAELVQAFKPEPAVYELALRMLQVPPEETLMVAAHPWDLRAAARHGIATAFVNRPGADQPDPDDHSDLTVDDLGQLATRLGG